MWQRCLVKFFIQPRNLTHLRAISRLQEGFRGVSWYHVNFNFNMRVLEVAASKTNPPIATLLTAEHVQENSKVTIKWGETTSLKLTDTLTVCGNHAIARHLARINPGLGLYGKDALQATEVDHWLEFASTRLSDHGEFAEALKYLERVLAPVTNLVGHSFSLADFAVWGALRANPRWESMLNNQSASQHVSRWYNYCNSQEAFRKLSSQLPSNQAPRQKAEEGGKFIELEGATVGNVVTRFPPEASGYLHIGHAKAALLNQHYRDIYKGKLIMRFDDTNPAKENKHFEEVILEDLKMLNFKPDQFSHTSDYFEQLLNLGTKLIKNGNGYIDDTSAEQMKAERDERSPSKNRDNSVEKNLEMWKEMIEGTERGQQCVLRAKMDYQSDNGCLRDPTMYRCKVEPHVRFGHKYKVYPTYDFACPVVDSLEGVTHALRTTEYHDRDPQYYWIIEKLGLRKPIIWEFSKLNLIYTVLSKRRLTWLVDEGKVDGWDDPRFPTVRGVLRRGMTVEGLKEFIVLQGSSKSNVHMEWDKIWAMNRKVIDPVAPRYTALMASQVVPLSLPGATVQMSEHPVNAKNPDQGTKQVWYGPKVFIEGEDAMALSEGQMVTLMNWGNVNINQIKRNSSGDVESLEATLCLENKDYKKTTKLTWLADVDKAPSIPTIMVNFDYLINKALTKTDDFKEFLNENTRFETEMSGDPALVNVKKGDIIQLQRRGFFICDQAYEPPSRHTSRATPCILFSIPDGHTKNMPAPTVSKNKPKEEKTKAVKIPEKNGKTEQTENTGATGNTNTPEAEALKTKVLAQGEQVRQLKTSGASKEAIGAEVASLLSLKAEYKELTGMDAIPAADNKRGKKNPVKISEKTEKNVKIEQTEKTADTGTTNTPEAEALKTKILAQGEQVRQLKTSGASKEAIGAEVTTLLSLKAEYKELTGVDAIPAADNKRGKKDKKKENNPAEKQPENKEKKDKKEKKKEQKKQEKKQTQQPGIPAAESSATKKLTRLGLETRKEDNLADWYSQIITKSELIEYYDVSGCYILRPWSYSMWEIIRDFFDSEIKKLGVENVYFPIFVSKAALEKEKTHIADFAPEVAWVTKSGESELAEPIAIRPTSETVMYPAYAKWIQSYRDLPLKLNQWNNVVRWEFKHPQPFLRTREFLWQEGHSAFATKEEAVEEVYAILDLYYQVYADIMAVPVIKGKKTEKEKFAGGDFTTTVEAFISASGRGIQGATSHHLGQNFSKMFDIVIEDPEKVQDKLHVYQNSWGLTTRTLGVVVMVHGDNQGLVLPPRLAQIQVIIIPCGVTVSLKDEDKQKLYDRSQEYEKELKAAGCRAKVDFRENYSPGWKFNHWELKGVPIRLELGPRDLKEDKFVVCRRDTGEKSTLNHSGGMSEVKLLLDNIQKDMYNRAKKELDDHLKVTQDWKEFCSLLDQQNIIMAPFCGDIPCEEKIKKDSAREDVEGEAGAPAMGAKALCIPFEQPAQVTDDTKCVHPDCGHKAQYYTLFGRSY